MKKCISVLMVVTSCMLTACGGGSVEVTAHIVEYTPELRRFDVVDSHGVDTANAANTLLRLNPYVDNGLFDVYWRVNSLEDYQVNVRINDVNNVRGSYLIYSQRCGAGKACDQGGGVICQYTADFTLSCDNANNPRDIEALFKQVPQNLYLMLEVCDLNSSYCEYDSYPVLME